MKIHILYPISTLPPLIYLSISFQSYDITTSCRDYALWFYYPAVPFSLISFSVLFIALCFAIAELRIGLTADVLEDNVIYYLIFNDTINHTNRPFWSHFFLFISFCSLFHSLLSVHILLKNENNWCCYEYGSATI